MRRALRHLNIPIVVERVSDAGSRRQVEEVSVPAQLMFLERSASVPKETTGVRLVMFLRPLLVAALLPCCAGE